METRKKIKSSPADKVFTVCNTIFMILFIIVSDSEYACSCI
jgi:putative aldouronate transport system permease protein